MSSHDPDESFRRTAVRFLDQYLLTVSDIEQLRSDIGGDRWENGITNDPALWFDWVQARWEASGVQFDRTPLVPGRNPLATESGLSAVLEVPYDGSDPTAKPEVNEVKPGDERAGLKHLRELLGAWDGTITELRDWVQARE